MLQTNVSKCKQACMQGACCASQAAWQWYKAAWLLNTPLNKHNALLHGHVMQNTEVQNLTSIFLIFIQISR